MSRIEKETARLEGRKLTPAAERANREADKRRSAGNGPSVNTPAETGGRGGLDPARYGDWEKGGIASDF